MIIDDNGQVEDDIDDSWNFVNEIVNENGLESNIPDLPPDDKPVAVKKIIADIISDCVDMKEEEEKELVTKSKAVAPNNVESIKNAQMEDDEKDEGEHDDRKETVDVYSLLFDAMKDKNASVAEEDQPKIPIESLMQIETENKLKSTDDSFIAKVN